MSTLVLATEGCCKGHPCDNCKTCQSGRCCRRDNPDYKLPELGDWDGPIYGELGVLNDDGERVECHCCGEWFSGLGIHAALVHDLTAIEYRAVFGLRSEQGLVSSMLRKQMQKCPQLAKLKEAGQVQQGRFRAMTAEQHSHYASRPKRLQTRLAERTNRPESEAKKIRLSLAFQGVKMSGSHASRYVGVYWNKQRRQWVGRITLRKQHIYLGTFESEEATARAYDAKARELYGDKARLNFPEATS